MISTQFSEHLGVLAESSQIASLTEGATIYLNECPPFPEHLLEKFIEMGICESTGDWTSRGSFEITLEMSESLSLTLEREARPQAIEAMTRLDQLMYDGFLFEGELAAQILFFPDEDEPASLAAHLELEGVGEVALYVSAPDVQAALEVMRRVVPGAYLDS